MLPAATPPPPAPGRGGARQAGCFTLWVRQVSALTKKNFLLTWRLRRSTAGELVAPLLIICLIGLLDFSLKSGLPDSRPSNFSHISSEVFPCRVFDNEDGKHGYGRAIPGAWCVPIVYAPAGVSDVDQLMSLMAQRNGYDAPTVSAGVEHTSAPPECGASGDTEQMATKACMLGFPTVPAMKAWLRAHEGRTGAAVIFGDTTETENADGSTTTAQVITEALPEKNIKYEVWTNSTAISFKWYAGDGVDVLASYADTESSEQSQFAKDSSLQLRVQRAVDDAIITWWGARAGRDTASARLEVDLRPFPRLKDTRGLGQVFGAFTIFISLIFSFLTLIIRVVTEKERHISGAMRSTGLSDIAYWLSYWAHALVSSLLTAAIVYLMGAGIGLEIFVNSEGSLLYLIILVYLLAMAAFAFFLASLIPKVRGAALCAIFLVIPCATIAVISGLWVVITYVWWESQFPVFVTVLLKLLLPPFDLIKIISDASEMTASVMQMNATTGKMEWVPASAGGFSYERLFNYSINRTAYLTFNAFTDPPELGIYEPPPPGDSIVWLLISLALYVVLAWYSAQVYPFITDAKAMPYWFPLLPSYWLGGSGTSGAVNVKKVKTRLKRFDPSERDDLDDDVRAEMAAVCAGEPADGVTVEVLGLKKVYRGALEVAKTLTMNLAFKLNLGPKPPKTGFHAVKGMCFRLYKDQCFALLGHNGAGKTTTIKMMTAQVAATQGEVTVHGLAVSADASAIRAFLGICPQHDILYDELTCDEHLELYGALKGISKASLRQTLPEILKGVRLTRVRHHVAGSYSGGMKRRLSVAVSLIGQPKVIMLDEPTTGMDPMNRKHVWDLIERTKAERTVLLTTHSMEEADTLGDRIGIMSAGQLVALGSSLHLKEKFGEGYRVKLVVPRGSREVIKERVAELVPSAVLVDDNAGDMTYALPDAETLALAPALFAYIEEVQAGKHSSLALTDWGVSHTTLEDVFLKLAKHEDGQAETFPCTINLPKTFDPDNPAEIVFVAKDGLPYNVPRELLPTRKQWESNDISKDAPMIDIKLPKRFPSYQDKKYFARTTHVRFERNPWSDTPPHEQKLGITLKSDGPDAHPVVEAIAEGALAAYSTLRVGDCIIALNGERAFGQVETTNRLKACPWVIHLQVRRSDETNAVAKDATKAEKRPKERSQLREQLGALFMRTNRLQRRQRCVCLFSFLVPIACMLILVWYQKNVVEMSGARLKAMIDAIRDAGKYGCANTTAQFDTLCRDRVNNAGSGFYDDCTWCAREFEEFPFGGTVFNVCPFINPYFPGTNGDQCRSDYLGTEPTAAGWSRGVKANFPSCSTYESGTMPQWCNCSSTMYTELVEGTPYCKLDKQFNGIFLQDPRPVKVLRNFSEGGFMFVFDVTPTWVPDLWKNYVGWRIPIAVPPNSAVSVGQMQGLLTDNGYVGKYNFTSDDDSSIAADIRSRVSRSGLLAHMPMGIAFNDLPDVNAWTEERSCRASHSETRCCVQLVRIPESRGESCQRKGECICDIDELEAALPLDFLECVLCTAITPAALEPGGTPYSQQISFWRGDESGNPEDECYEDRTIRYQPIDWTTKRPYCTSTSCMMSSCVPAETAEAFRGGYQNERCASVLPDMAVHCTRMREEAAAACAAGQLWMHPAIDPSLLYFQWQAHSGSLGWTPPGQDRLVGIGVTTAFTHAQQWSMNATGAVFHPATSCAPPFCFNFMSAALGGNAPTDCAVDSPAFLNHTAALDLIYPCNGDRASVYANLSSPVAPATHGHPSGSTAEGLMCREAYALAAIVYPGWAGSNWAAVPECAPDGAINGGQRGYVNGTGLSGAYYPSCFTCSETSCPVYHHFVCPMYQEATSIDEISDQILTNQLNIRDGTTSTMPLPTMPIVDSTAFSREIEKIFPSVALQVSRLDMASLDMHFSISSFWGGSTDWPYVRPPDSWQGYRKGGETAADSAGNVRWNPVKFFEGLGGLRLAQSGGMGSIMLNWMTNALLRTGLDPELTVTTGMRPFPYEVQVSAWINERDNVAGAFAFMIDLVVPLGTSISLPILAATVVMEKEHRLRALMVMMGLRMRWYWLCEWLWNSTFMLVLNLSFLLVGFIGGVPFITRSPGVFAILMVVWSQCIVVMAMLFSSFYNRLLSSYVGNFLLIVVFWMLSFVLNQFTLNRPSDVFPTPLFLLPPLAYYRAIHLLVKRTYLIELLSGEMLTIILMLVLDVVVYGALGMYLDVVLPRQFGVVKHPLFFITPLCKLLGCMRSRSSTSSNAVDPNEDADVRVARVATEAKMKNGAWIAGEPEPIEVVNLRKVYKNGKVAVDNSSFSISKGECFGLLGPNGAGKTTTISMLTGLYPPSAGHARVCGFDLRTQMDKIYEVMGVCPQFDILWPLLSVVETLVFYVKIKCVPHDKQKEEASQAAYNVDLGHVPNRLVGRLSGGMKRRVSLSISLIGDPKVVMLDEPTTGLDPETKRLMWTLIDLFKTNRCIVLTTHSMEEADALCGRISIMAYGRLKCLGSSLRLKGKFGDGHKIEVSYKEGSALAATTFVMGLVPAANKMSDFAGLIIFKVAANQMRVSELFEQMEARPMSAGISDWALRQTSMEEVFLRVATASEVENEKLVAVTSSRTADDPKAGLPTKEDLPASSPPSPPVSANSPRRDQVLPMQQTDLESMGA